MTPNHSTKTWVFHHLTIHSQKMVGLGVPNTSSTPVFFFFGKKKWHLLTFIPASSSCPLVTRLGRQWEKWPVEGQGRWTGPHDLRSGLDAPSQVVFSRLISKKWVDFLPPRWCLAAVTFSGPPSKRRSPNSLFQICHVSNHPKKVTFWNCQVENDSSILNYKGISSLKVAKCKLLSHFMLDD